jgi:hypothetical protein
VIPHQMSDSRVIFECRICRTAIRRRLLSSKPSISLPRRRETCTSSGVFWESTKRNKYWSAAIGVLATCGTKHHSDFHRLDGCCGLDGLDGSNLVCAVVTKSVLKNALLDARCGCNGFARGEGFRNELRPQVIFLYSAIPLPVAPLIQPSTIKNRVFIGFLVTVLVRIRPFRNQFEAAEVFLVSFTLS